MTRVLAAAVVVAQLLDLATWLAMPRAAEVNPIAVGLHTEAAWLAKGLLLVVVLGIQPALRPKYAPIAELVAVVAIAAGCVGAGSNLAVLAYVAAAEAPRPAALLVIPADPTADVAAPEGHRVRSSGTEAERRTPAPRQSAPGSSDLRGRASWFRVDGDAAAAGPGLRRSLGRGWRGTLVRVSAGGRSVVVRLTDWCQCYRGTATERLLDLSDGAFAELAPLSTGLLAVRVSTILPPPTDR